VTPTEVTNENSEDKPIIQEEQEIAPEQADEKSNLTGISPANSSFIQINIKGISPVNKFHIS